MSPHIAHIDSITWLPELRSAERLLLHTVIVDSRGVADPGSGRHPGGLPPVAARTAVEGARGSRVVTGHTKGSTRGERCGGLRVTLACADADPGQWSWRESNLPRSVGTGWSGAVTCGDVGATHASGGAVGLIR